MSYDQDEEATDQLLLAASQAYEETVYEETVYEETVTGELPLTASPSSQQGDLVN